MKRDWVRSKICVSVAEPSVEACLAALQGLEFAEVRLDAIENLSLDRMALLFESGRRRVATCRPGQGDEAQRTRWLVAAIRAGASYVDVEIDAGESLRKDVVRAARQFGCDVIVSHHDYESTPAPGELGDLVGACFSAGADVAKIACRAKSPRDAARLLGLLDDSRRLIVIGMGIQGVVTRVAGPLLGSEFTFASLRQGGETAPGQLEVGELESRMLRMMDEMVG